MCMKMQFRKFDISKLRCDHTVMVIGKRGTGKSFLAKDLLYHHRDLPIGTVISRYESTQKFYGDIPDRFIHDAYAPGVIEDFVNRQKVMMDRHDVDPRAFLVLDCMYDNSWTRDKIARLLFLSGRSLNVMLVFMMQFPIDVPANIDFVFIFQDRIVSNRTRIYENFVRVFPTFDVFCQALDQCTDDYQCLVIDNNAETTSPHLQDHVFWYRAEHHDEFHIGAHEWSQECEMI